MACVDANQAVEFVEGSLPAGGAAAVERHMARCAECRRLIGELARAGSRVLASPPGPAPDPTDAADTERDDEALASTGPARPGHPDLDLRPGSSVGRYVVLEALGAGGMGVVFAAYDPKLDRKIALKFIRGRVHGLASEDARARLTREAQAIARLNHPNVVGVYDVGTYEGRVYIAMEFVSGPTLTGWLCEQPRSRAEVLEVFAAAGQGLAAAHEAGIVHRDFKPDNVLFGADGRVRVMDFGLARAAAEPEAIEATVLAAAESSASALAAELTRTGAILGTPRYMAPEQFAGRTAGPRTDQFSFCVALYEALYGLHPLQRGTAAGLTAGRSLADELLPAPEGSTVPAWLREVLVRGLAVDPEDRHPSMAALLAALRARLRPSRAPWLAPAIAVAAAGLVLIAWRGMASDESARREVEAASTRARLAAEEAASARDQAAQLRDEIRELRAALAARRLTDARVRELELELLDKEERLLAILEQPPETRTRPLHAGAPFSGVLDRAVVRRAVEQRRRGLEACYERARRTNPTLGGWVSTEFAIGPDGHVLWVTTSGLRDLEAGECVKTLLRGVTFPRSEVGTLASYAFHFRPRGLEVRDGQTGPDQGEGAHPPGGVLGVRCSANDPLCGVE